MFCPPTEHIHSITDHPSRVLVVDDLEGSARLAQALLRDEGHHVLLASHGKNQLGIIVGFSELLLQDMDERQTRRSDFEAIRVAANRAMDLLALAPFPRDKRS